MGRGAGMGFWVFCIVAGDLARVSAAPLGSCWDGSAPWLGSACPWGRLGGRPQPAPAVRGLQPGGLADWGGGQVRLGWLSSIGAVDLDACVGVVSALRSRAGPRGSQEDKVPETLRDFVLLRPSGTLSS